MVATMRTGQPSSTGGQANLRVLAHDLRSALAASTAYLDLAREQAERGEPVSREDLDRVERALARMNEAIAQLEMLAREARA